MEDQEKRHYEELLIQKMVEIERMKPLVADYEKHKQIKCEEIRLQLGDRWRDSYSSLSLSELNDLSNLLFNR